MWQISRLTTCITVLKEASTSCISQPLSKKLIPPNSKLLVAEVGKLRKVRATPGKLLEKLQVGISFHLASKLNI